MIRPGQVMFDAAHGADTVMLMLYIVLPLESMGELNAVIRSWCAVNSNSEVWSTERNRETTTSFVLTRVTSKKKQHEPPFRREFTRQSSTPHRLVNSLGWLCASPDCR